MPSSGGTSNAQWSINSYTVTFNGNTNTGGSTAAQSLVYNTATALTSNGFTKTGYTFAGWATTAGGAVAYANGASYTIGAAGVTLYAKWTAVTNTITFNGNTSTGGSTASQNIATDALATLTSNGFTKTGYTFAGWATTAGGAVAYANGASYTIGAAGVTLYAKWTIDTYTIIVAKNGTGFGLITSNTGGINFGATSTATYNYNSNIILTATPSVGSTFTGWSGAFCSGTGTCTINIVGNDTATATFVYDSPTILSVNPNTGYTTGGTGITITGTNFYSGGIPVSDSNTIGLWHMDEAASSPVGDSSANNNFGTAVGTTIVDGKFGKARSFNGSGDKISTPASGFDYDNITIEAWIKPNSLSSRHTIIDVGTGTNLIPQLEIGTCNAGAAVNAVCVITPGIWQAQTINNVITTGTWTHIAYTKSGPGATHKIYVNGILQTLVTNSSADYDNISAARTIGARSGSTQYFNGLIDEVKLSDVARTQDEITIDANPLSLSLLIGDATTTSLFNVSSTTIIATTSGHTAGMVDVVVTNPDGLSATSTGGYIYIEPAHSLNIIATGTGSGIITSDVGGMDCGFICTVVYNYGTYVTLTANSNIGNTFIGWSGGGCSGTSTCIVRVNTVTTITATFTVNSHTLNVSKLGVGSGIITSNIGDIDCGSTCSDVYNYGDVIVFTATSSPGSVFSSWGIGGCTGTSTCTIIITGNTTLTATFNFISINVSRQGAQISTTTIPITNQNIGGAFTFSIDSGTTDISSIVLHQAGSLSADNNISNLKLWYEATSTCSATKPSDATPFGTGSDFINNVSTTTGIMTVGLNNVCLYVTYDINTNYAINLIGQTIDLQISVPSADIIVSNGVVSSASRVNIAGVTMIITANDKLATPTTSNPACSDDRITSVLSLHMINPNKDPTVYYLQNCSIWKITGGGKPLRLSNPNLQVQEFILKSMTGLDIIRSIKMTITVSNMDSSNKNTLLNISRTYTTSAGVKARPE